MKKIFKMMALIFVLIPFYSNAEKLNAQDLKASGATDCFTYELTADKTTVSEGEQLQVKFSYESVKPACTAEEVANTSVQIDLSNLVADGTDISGSFDSDVLTIDISPEGIVTVKFKDLSEDNETLADFGGDVILTIVAGDLNGSDVTINDSVGNTVVIDVNPGNGEQNTNKVSDVDYGAVGDIVNYSVLINHDKNNVDTFKGVDSASAGLEYVPNSFWVEEDGTWQKNDDLFTATINSDGNLEVSNNASFDGSYLLHYQMKIVEQQEVYTNKFDATYDGHTDAVSDDVSFDFDGGSWIDYTSGKFEINKLNNDGEGLKGAEFDLYDKNDKVIEHLITDESGKALSNKHALGSYYLIETKAPEGYVLNSDPINIEITEDTSGDVIQEVKVYNDKISGQVDLNKVDEDNNALAGVEFTIYDQNDQVVEVITTNEKGYAISGDLAYGDYYLKETKALDGYKINDEVYNFSIENNGELVHVNGAEPIVNIKYQTPDIDLPIVEKPSKPEIPAIPITPSKPVIPEIPIDPSKPVTPVTPIGPSKPVTPVTPIGPSKPVTPVTPIDPSKPVTPVTPIGPSKPVTPVTPIGPSKPVTPVTPIDPSKPVTPVTPIGPSKPVTPVTPIGPSKPVTPVTPIGPSKPVTPVVPSKPIDTEKPTDTEKPSVTTPKVSKPKADEKEKTLANTSKPLYINALILGLIALIIIVIIRKFK